MRIVMLGAREWGSSLRIFKFQRETAVFDVNPHQLRFVSNTYRFTTLEEIKEFEPELVINAATVKYTPGGLSAGVARTAQRLYHQRYRFGKNWD